MTDEQAPLQLTPQAVVDELLKIPGAHPYWDLAQERATTRLLGDRARRQDERAQEQEQELQKLRNELARRDRDDQAADDAPATPSAGPDLPASGVVTREL